jgi:hypothetical protein
MNQHGTPALEVFPREQQVRMGWDRNTFTSQNLRGSRLNILAHLRQAIEVMQQPEEVFHWLSTTIMQRFDVPVVQLWTCENGGADQPTAQLWAMASQNPSQPLYALSEKFVPAIERISHEQRPSTILLVEQAFPPYLASLLKRYGLRCCAFCLTGGHGRSAQAKYTLSAEPARRGVTFIALLLLQGYPAQELLPTIAIIMEQAIALAESRGLLRFGAASSGSLSLPQETSPREVSLALPGLIPRQKQNAGLMLSSNPFASSVTISDKQALRLYEAIDGYKTVAELCNAINMTLQEAQVALQVLASLQCIEMYTPGGQPVDVTLLLRNH